MIIRAFLCNYQSKFVNIPFYPRQTVVQVASIEISRRARSVGTTWTLVGGRSHVARSIEVMKYQVLPSVSVRGKPLFKDQELGNMHESSYLRRLSFWLHIHVVVMLPRLSGDQASAPVTVSTFQGIFNLYLKYSTSKTKMKSMAANNLSC